MAAADAPWYRHPWPWLLMLPPASTIVFWAVILLTTSEPPALVVNDYARLGLTYAEDHQRDATTRQLGIRAQLTLDPAAGQAQLQLEAPGAPPDRLRLELIHPTRASRDRQLELVHRGGWRFTAPLDALAESRWRILLEPPGNTWRLRGRLETGVHQLALAPPPAADGPAR